MAKAQRQPKRRQKTIEDLHRENLAPVRKELIAAYAAVGPTPPKRLKWLLEFAYKDLNDLTKGRLVDLGWEVAMFGVNKKPDQIPNERDSFMDLHILAGPYTPEEAMERRGMPLTPSETLLRDFHSSMRNVFNLLFAGEWWEFKPPSAVHRIALSSIKGRDGAVKADNAIALTADQILVSRAFDLLKVEKGRLGVCQNLNCKRPFATLRKTIGKFCSPRCSAYVRVNKARGKL